jgi:hypothetical protein
VFAPSRSASVTKWQLAKVAAVGSVFTIEEGVAYPELQQLGTGGYIVPANTSFRIQGVAGNSPVVVGRGGAGPLEFRGIAALCVTRGDTLVVWDPGLRRVSIISAQLRLIRSFILAAGFIAPTACLDYGGFVTQRIATDPRTEQRWLEVYEHDLFEGPLKRIARVAVGPIDPVFFVEPTVVAVGSEVYISVGLLSEVHVYSRAGGVERLFRTNDQSRRVERSERRSRIALLERLIPRQGSSRPSWLGSAGQFTSWPAVARISVGRDRSIWFKDYPQDGKAAPRWVGYWPDGSPIGGVATSARSLSGETLTILRFLSRDTVVVLRTNDAGIRSVELRELESVG